MFYYFSEPEKVKTYATEMLPKIIGGIAGCIILIGAFLVVVCYQCYQIQKSKERTTKMIIEMNSPVTVGVGPWDQNSLNVTQTSIGTEVTSVL